MLTSTCLAASFTVIQRSDLYIHLMSRSYPLKLIISRNLNRKPCECGFYISSAFLHGKRIQTRINLFRHPDEPNVFEFAYEHAYYTLTLQDLSATISEITCSVGNSAR
ncbi:hypothetical protein [Arsenicibacter rosenii]|uniref:Uncharacterized protein n=1 Tax=Arsenicibacter rosenii TaxID=1750698 RepID=A0A1S2VMZ7_9BACT|nr:hypothetical protein [Arsenicibacter rosenii]OIN60124.1 hypothetical protein BLX24_04575 [Arsenicibacter rosenii]